MGKKIKFGITAPVPGESVEGLIKFAADAENAGFDTVWFPDHVVFMAKRLTPEVWSVITAASMKTSSVIMGTVGDSHRMHPAVFAHRLATVDHVSNGPTRPWSISRLCWRGRAWCSSCPAGWA